MLHIFAQVLFWAGLVRIIEIFLSITSIIQDYQRRLWDPQCVAVNEGLVQEWHSHIYGKVGIFMFDLRGNRITADGVQQSDLPLISDEQWAAFEEFMANDQLKAIILCSETPFIGEEPSVCIAKVEASSKCDFLRDHWYFNEQELLKLGM